jgi:flagellar hook protein FlgE
MSLYGALYSGVSGLKAQGSAIGIVSDNISNLNTVGYKQGSAQFETLVNNSASTVAYNPGGVLARNRYLVDKQGLFQASDSPTDIAISGSGMLVVNRSNASNGDFLYTRAGSFRQDSEGNFINSSGFFLQGWPLDRDGRLPGEAGNLNTAAFANLDSLETVNVESSSGIAAATTTIEIGANLDASQTIYPGSGRESAFRSTGFNEDIAAKDVIVPFTGVAGTTGALASGDSISVTTAGPAGSFTHTFTYGGVEVTTALPLANFGGVAGNNITTTTQTFYPSGSAPTGTDATFTINTQTTGTVTFTYTQSSPNPFLQQFNSLQSLANAINEVNGLSARIVGTQIYIAPDDANEALDFNYTGAAAFDWPTNLGLADTLAATAGVERFASLQDLANKVNESDGISAVIDSPLAETAITIRTDDPEGTITFDDSTGVAGNYAVLTQFGFTDTFTAPATVTVPDRTFGPEYDALNPSTSDGDNMASGLVTAHFSRTIRVYDSLGVGHDVELAFLKKGVNTWAVEMYAKTDTEVSTSFSDAIITYGEITFNGDGSLRDVSTQLSNPISVVWTNGSVPSEITIDWGSQGQPFGTEGATEIGLTDGLSQYSGDYSVNFVKQNGAAVGTLIGVNIDADGFVIASYSNGEAQRLFKVPIADFANVNGLKPITGNVYQATDGSGVLNLREAGENGVGTFQSGALESSNVELAEELTDMIVAQRAYQASSKVISTSDELLEELTRL